MGLGSLIGDFFQNVKDTVTGVARAVAPIAPYVLPFLPIPGGPIAKQLIGAGIGLAAGQKPVDIAKNMALQAATSGIASSLSGGRFGQSFGEQLESIGLGRSPTKTIDTGAISTTPSFQDPGIAMGDYGIGQQVEPNFFQKVGGATKNFFTEGYGARLNPFSDASMMNPKFQAGLDMGFTEKELFKMGIEPQRGFLSRIAPAAALASASIPVFLPKTPVDDTDYVQQARDDFYISYARPRNTGDGLAKIPGAPVDDTTFIDLPFERMLVAAEGGEVTGGVASVGQKIEHSNGKVKEHPRRIGEIAGPGTGTSDDIPAMLSDGEFVMTAQAVRNAGGGSRKAGAKNMYKLMKNLEKGGSLSEQSLGMVGRA